MGSNLLKHAYNHFDTYETLHQDTIFNHVLIDFQIDMYRISLVCACAMYAHARACICVYVDTFVYICTQVARICLDIPHHMSGTFQTFKFGYF